MRSEEAISYHHTELPCSIPDFYNCSLIHNYFPISSSYCRQRQAHGALVSLLTTQTNSSCSWSDMGFCSHSHQSITHSRHTLLPATCWQAKEFQWLPLTRKDIRSLHILAQNFIPTVSLHIRPPLAQAVSSCWALHCSFRALFLALLPTRSSQYHSSSPGSCLRLPWPQPCMQGPGWARSRLLWAPRHWLRTSNLHVCHQPL